MQIEFTHDWCLKMASLEGDSEIGAGLLAVDPTFEEDDTHSDLDNTPPSDPLLSPTRDPILPD
jgi:hypothetical protein